MNHLKSSVCYTDDWRRTNPDLVVYLPAKRRGTDGYADHFLVDYTPGGDLLAIWTQSGAEGSFDSRVVFARSEDGGQSWTAPQVLAGAGLGTEPNAMFGFPVMSRTGRSGWVALRFANHPAEAGC